MINTYELSIADYYRFMCGWGQWGNHRWAEKKTNLVLDKLENKK